MIGNCGWVWPALLWLPLTHERSYVSVSNGVPPLRLSGAPGTYELQATSNLASWFSGGTVSTATNTANANDKSATNASGRVYRTPQ